MAAPHPEKVRHLAAFLPLAGLFLLMPPALLVFGVGAVLAGIPLIVLYIFGIWAVLIAGAAVMARYLAPGDLADKPASADVTGQDSGHSLFDQDQSS